jgi:hypothetical protein
MATSKGRGLGGTFINKAVVRDAEKIRALLDDPATRVQTLEMLQRLVSR